MRRSIFILSLSVILLSNVFVLVLSLPSAIERDLSALERDVNKLKDNDSFNNHIDNHIDKDNDKDKDKDKDKDSDKGNDGNDGDDASAQSALGIVNDRDKFVGNAWIPPKDNNGGDGNPGRKIKPDVIDETLNEDGHAHVSLFGDDDSELKKFQERLESDISGNAHSISESFEALIESLDGAFPSGLETTPCSNMQCYKERLERLHEDKSIMAELNEHGEFENRVQYALLHFSSDVKSTFAAKANTMKCSDSRNCENASGMEHLRRIVDRQREFVSKRPAETVKSGSDTDGIRHPIHEDSPVDAPKHISDDSGYAPTLLQEKSGAVDEANIGTENSMANKNNNNNNGNKGDLPPPKLGMSKEAFKDKLVSTMKSLVRTVPEIYFIGGGVNLNVINGAVEAAIDLERYESALFAQGGSSFGTDLVSVAGANLMQGAAWKRSKKGGPIEEYGGNGVSFEAGGDIEVTVSLAAEIDAGDNFAPEWDGILKAFVDIGIDFGVPTGVSVNVGASMCDMIPRTKVCCASRRCMAWQIMSMPGSWNLKAPLMAALALFPPPQKAHC